MRAAPLPPASLILSVLLLLLGGGCAEGESLPGSASPTALGEAAYRSLRAGKYGEWLPLILPHVHGGLTDEELAERPARTEPSTGIQQARVQDRFDYVACALRLVALPAEWRMGPTTVGPFREVGDGRVACTVTLTVHVGSGGSRQIIIGCTRTLGRWYSNHGVLLLKE